ATVAIMHSQSIYWRTNQGKIRRKNSPEDVRELAHFFIREREALEMKFDQTTGTFQKMPMSGELPRTTPSGKGGVKPTLWTLLTEQRRFNAQLDTYQTTYSDDYSSHPEYLYLLQQLSHSQDTTNRLLALLVQSVAAKIRDIVLYYARKYPTIRVRVQIEDLRRSKIDPSASIVQPNHYLTQEQTFSFYTRIQTSLVHLLREYAIGVWRVAPIQGSQVCALCGGKGSSQKNLFTCANNDHTNASGRAYTSKANLNNARNIALFPPLVKRPLVT
ncbi:MAG: hypothetical protein ACFFC7_26385, partial [Candidatus Hermodarchaeota archaeon]